MYGDTAYWGMVKWVWVKGKILLKSKLCGCWGLSLGREETELKMRGGWGEALFLGGEWGGERRGEREGGRERVVGGAVVSSVGSCSMLCWDSRSFERTRLILVLNCL
jgi:hypothetical protein